MFRFIAESRAFSIGYLSGKHFCCRPRRTKQTFRELGAGQAICYPPCRLCLGSSARMQQTTAKGLAPLSANDVRRVRLFSALFGHSKMALLLGYVINLVLTFILAVAFLC